MQLHDLLNEEQIKPVTDTEGQVLVLAGAGSGKTRVLTYRIAYLINEKKVNPYNILAITFTNKAANEMKERIMSVTSRSDVWVSTFHSLCAKVLRIDADKLGYTSTFSIYSENDSDKLIKRIFQERGIDNTEARSNARFHISQAKTMGLTPAEYQSQFEFVTDISLYCSVYARYEEELKKSNAMDFDDLLIKTAELFVNHPDVLKKYQERFHYVHVDEFQDTSRLQYMIVRLLSMRYQNVFAVGDDDQSIYSWRGADVTNIRDFRRDFPNARMYKLERNYRSTPEILKAANAVIANNTQRIGKELWTENRSGVRVEVYNGYNDREEADYVIGAISDLLRNGYSPSDFAILVRQNSLTRLFEERLNMYNIPYVVFKGHKFFERKEIKDMISYLRLVVNPLDTESIARIINFPKRGIGDTTVDKLRAYAKDTDSTLFDVILDVESIDSFSTSVKTKVATFKDVVLDLVKASSTMGLSDFMDYLLKRIELKSVFDRRDEDDDNTLRNIEEFVESVKEYDHVNSDATIVSYLENVSLLSDMDKEDLDEHVTIATVHAVKGLEYKVVFVVALEEGIFPGKRTIMNPDEMEEERRVMYVAMTRARERLYLTYTNNRFMYNKPQYNPTSRFVKELQAAIRPETTTKPKTTFVPKTLPAKNVDEFRDGVRIVHDRFGEGMIVSTQGSGADKVVSISFPGLGIKTFLLKLAPIKVVR